MFEPWFIAPIASIISILAGLYFYYYVEKLDSGTPLMKEITEAIKEGSQAFLKREYTILLIFVLIVGTLIGVVLPKPIWASPNPIENISLSLSYFFGGLSPMNSDNLIVKDINIPFIESQVFIIY